LAVIRFFVLKTLRRDHIRESTKYAPTHLKKAARRDVFSSNAQGLDGVPTMDSFKKKNE
jgi:hypothetical protein